MSDRRQAIEEAFIKDLRTVVMVDDQFPSFEEACAGTASLRTEKERAVALWKGFRQLGMACEIENEPVPPPDHLRKGDLIILDYHLTGDHDDGSEARRLLRALVDDGRQHLVIVYTSDSRLRDVCLCIAATVAGVAGAGPAPLSESDADDFDEWKRERRYEVPESAFVKYIQRNSCWYTACMRELKEDKGDRAQLRRFLERLAYEKAASYGATRKDSLHKLEISCEKAPWVRCDNVFVVVVHKGDEELSDQEGLNAAVYLRDRLLDALAEWNPSFLRVMLNHARHRIVEQGFIGDDRVLKTPVSEAGWLLFMKSGTPEERRERVVALYGRLFEDLVVEALGHIEAFSERHERKFVERSEEIPTVENLGASTRVVLGNVDLGISSTHMAGARLRAGVDESVEDEAIVHTLNEFLAFEDKNPTFLRTGTVFMRAARGGEPAICTTPDCDLVPRIPTSGWGKRLHPFVPVLYRPVSLTKEFKEVLARAEDARALFRKVNDSLHALRLLTDEGAHRRPEMIFVDDGGRINDKGEFLARSVLFNGQKLELQLQPAEKFVVLGQLRARYAMRLLHETGQHLSRIGVDFVDWPPRSRMPE